MAAYTVWGDHVYGGYVSSLDPDLLIFKHKVRHFNAGMPIQIKSGIYNKMFQCVNKFKRIGRATSPNAYIKRVRM